MDYSPWGCKDMTEATYRTRMYFMNMTDDTIEWKSICSMPNSRYGPLEVVLPWVFKLSGLT